MNPLHEASLKQIIKDRGCCDNVGPCDIHCPFWLENTDEYPMNSGCCGVMTDMDNRMVTLAAEMLKGPITLTEEQRDGLICELFGMRMDAFFGDGMEEEYVLEGFPGFEGLNNMTDVELLDEYYGATGGLNYLDEKGDDDDAL